MRRVDIKWRKRERTRKTGIKKTQTGEIERDSLNDTEHPRL